MIYGMKKFFSPSYNVYEMREKVLLDPNLLCHAFRERVYEYYIKPANKISAFAQRVLTSTLIDFLAKILYPNRKVGARIREFLIKILNFSEENAKSFYYYVRDGLIHEGRVKCGCYLDSEINETVQMAEGVLKFNPEMILKEVKIWFNTYLKKLEKGGETFQITRNYIEKKILDEDLIAIEERDNGNMFPCKFY